MSLGSGLPPQHRPSRPRTRYTPSKAGLAANAPWGVYDELAKVWVSPPALNREQAGLRAGELNAASAGRGR